MTSSKIQLVMKNQEDIIPKIWAHNLVTYCVLTATWVYIRYEFQSRGKQFQLFVE